MFEAFKKFWKSIRSKSDTKEEKKGGKVMLDMEALRKENKVPESWATRHKAGKETINLNNTQAESTQPPPPVKIFTKILSFFKKKLTNIKKKSLDEKINSLNSQLTKTNRLIKNCKDRLNTSKETPDRQSNSESKVDQLQSKQSLSYTQKTLVLATKSAASLNKRLQAAESIRDPKKANESNTVHTTTKSKIKEGSRTDVIAAPNSTPKTTNKTNARKR
jgi:hypothetical protein